MRLLLMNSLQLSVIAIASLSVEKVSPLRRMIAGLAGGFERTPVRANRPVRDYFAPVSPSRTTLSSHVSADEENAGGCQRSAPGTGV